MRVLEPDAYELLADRSTLARLGCASGTAWQTAKLRVLALGPGQYTGFAADSKSFDLTHVANL